MSRYETLILTVPEVTKDEESTLEFQVEKLINNAKGSIISFDRWGKYRLSYPVRKNDYGVYFLIRFDIEDKKSFVKDFQSLCYVKFNDIVMRFITTKVDKDQSLEYKKPLSLEDVSKGRLSFMGQDDSTSTRNGSRGQRWSKPKEETLSSESSNGKVDSEPVEDSSNTSFDQEKIDLASNQEGKKIQEPESNLQDIAKEEV